MTVLGKVISKTGANLVMELPLEGKITTISNFSKESKVKDMCKMGDYIVLEIDMLPGGQFEAIHMSFCKI